MAGFTGLKSLKPYTTQLSKPISLILYAYWKTHLSRLNARILRQHPYFQILCSAVDKLFTSLCSVFCVLTRLLQSSTRLEVFAYQCGIMQNMWPAGKEKRQIYRLHLAMTLNAMSHCVCIWICIYTHTHEWMRAKFQQWIIVYAFE